MGVHKQRKLVPEVKLVRVINGEVIQSVREGAPISIGDKVMFRKCYCTDAEPPIPSAIVDDTSKDPMVVGIVKHNEALGGICVEYISESGDSGRQIVWVCKNDNVIIMAPNDADATTIDEYENSTYKQRITHDGNLLPIRYLDSLNSEAYEVYEAIMGEVFR